MSIEYSLKTQKSLAEYMESQRKESAKTVYIRRNSKMTYTKEQLNDAKNRVSAFIKKNKRNPKTVKIGNDSVTYANYLKLIATTTTEYNNATFTQNQYKQDTNYYCGVNCLQLAIKKLTGLWINEKVLAGWAGTTTSGTSHTGLQTALQKFNKKYGYSLKMNWYNFDDLTWKQQGEYLSKSTTFLFYHLCYHNHSGSGYGSTGYGHYETLKNISVSGTTLKVYNSLSGGYIDSRTKATQKKWCSQISQKSLCVISK